VLQGDGEIAKLGPKGGDTARIEPKPGEVRKFQISKDVFMEFCWIPGGKATLGVPDVPKVVNAYETEHEIKTNGFLAGEIYRNSGGMERNDGN
jgi:hypothetical protein